MAGWTQDAFMDACNALAKKSREDAAFRKLAVADPAKAIREVSNMELPESFKLQIVDPFASLVVTLPPAKMQEGELSDAELTQVAGGSLWNDITSGFQNLGDNISSGAMNFGSGFLNGATGGTQGSTNNGSIPNSVGQGMGAWNPLAGLFHLYG